MPSIEELMAFYKENKAYVDLIVENALQNDPEKKQMRQQALFKAQMAEFTKEFPESGLESPEDFLNAAFAKDFLRYISKGLSIAEAYKLCNYAVLLESAKGKGKKAGLAQAASKVQMRPTGSTGAKAAAGVPEEVKEIYRILLSDWDDGKISKHYSRR